MDILSEFPKDLMEDSLEDLRELKHTLIMQSIVNGTLEYFDCENLTVDYCELLSATWSDREVDQLDSESMLYTDVIQYGALNRLFSKWTKDLSKMNVRFAEALKKIDEDVKESGYKKIDEEIKSEKSIWLTDYNTVVGLQNELQNMHKATYTLYSNPIDGKLSVLERPLSRIMQYMNIGDTKWKEAIKTFVFTTVGSNAFKALGAAVGHKLGGAKGAAAGLVAGSVVGNVVGAVGSAKFSSTESNGKKGFDLKKLKAVTERQIELNKSMGNISDYKKQLKVNLKNFSKSERKEFKEKMRTIKSSIKLTMSLIHVVNRGLIEAY